MYGENAYTVNIVITSERNAACVPLPHCFPVVSKIAATESIS